MLIDAWAVKDIEWEIENIKLELKWAKEYMKEQVKNNVPYDFFPTVTQSKYKMGKDGMTTILTFQIAWQLVIELEAILDRMRQWNIELKKHP